MLAKPWPHGAYEFLKFVEFHKSAIPDHESGKQLKAMVRRIFKCFAATRPFLLGNWNSKLPQFANAAFKHFWHWPRRSLGEKTPQGPDDLSSRECLLARHRGL